MTGPCPFPKRHGDQPVELTQQELLRARQVMDVAANERVTSGAASDGLKSKIMTAIQQEPPRSAQAAPTVADRADVVALPVGAALHKRTPAARPPAVSSAYASSFTANRGMASTALLAASLVLGVFVGATSDVSPIVGDAFNVASLTVTDDTKDVVADDLWAIPTAEELL